MKKEQSNSEVNELNYLMTYECVEASIPGVRASPDASVTSPDVSITSPDVSLLHQLCQNIGVKSIF